MLQESRVLVSLVAVGFRRGKRPVQDRSRMLLPIH